MPKSKKLTLSKFAVIFTVSMIATIYDCPIYAQITNSSDTVIQTGPFETTNANSSLGLSSLSILAQNGTNTSEGTFNGNNSDNNDNVNATQLSGDEKVSIAANFLSKPVGLPNDYIIEGRHAISINGITWDLNILSTTMMTYH
jgi:hypothetical protein